ncbi:PLDc N-terminal domain-containing protein, partial [Streptomyces rhizosphaericus]
MIAILSDIFRDREPNGGAKAAWTAFIVLLPWLGALSY